MPNRLAAESSPYLLQHQNNPVDWYPWGEEALQRSKAEEKPIFLSIGYSACHWCHVMEHESFENVGIANELNRLFVCIKVDREERPDLDQIYMNAVQLMTGRGGWPMSVFLTPDLSPFYGGTYWPPTARMGMPGFLDVVRAVADAWQNRRHLAVQQASEMTEHLKQIGADESASDPLELDLLDHDCQQLQRAFDPQFGGFGRAPKFPHSLDLQVLLRAWSRNQDPALLHIVTHTLDQMARGGIYDHLAGGFARYSVDERWLVPHFEKMLYDNALLTSAYLEVFQATANPQFAMVARETCDYILGWMTDEAGGFHSTEDADSEGEEGKFYVWKPDEITAILGQERGRVFCAAYDVTPRGNFEHGHSILNLPRPLSQVAAELGQEETILAVELAKCRQELLQVRERRIRPGKDDKILVSWNALMIDSLAKAAGVLHEPRYLQAAEKASTFLHEQLRAADGRLLHCWRHGKAKLAAYLDDYAYLANAWISLYEANFDARWLERASELCETLLQHFADAEGGGFYFTADDHEQLIFRNKDLHDSSVPSGNAMAATALVRLGKLTGNQTYLNAAEGALRAAMGVMQRTPTAAGQLFIALDLLLVPTSELVVIGDASSEPTASLLREFQQRFIPRRVLAAHQPGQVVPAVLQPLLAGKTDAVDGQPRVFVCQDFACQAPAVGEVAIRQLWQRLG
ncbi:Glycosyl hydrolase family 76 [Anatilimnocola aggregata]|uniref:Glycosyl hydrolase family 76 n=1 Tax=Anatilimnocola aggregata TaxID=2528021 RepID=A0A517YI90_9BACT|nr:thioredoxin domain-containing protein [Anatilimnocola aggregata]QDU29925.1 Glycosyl hydrolase family 76 [Anatilimnocola aggregata]